MVAAAAVTYKIKHDSEDRMRDVRKLETAIRYQEDTISILKADWALMIQPGRLQWLTEHFQGQLDLRPTEPQQFVKLSDIPQKQLVAREGEADGAKDKVKTGSVKP